LVELYFFFSVKNGARTMRLPATLFLLAASSMTFAWPWHDEPTRYGKAFYNSENCRYKAWGKADCAMDRAQYKCRTEAAKLPCAEKKLEMEEKRSLCKSSEFSPQECSAARRDAISKLGASKWLTTNWNNPGFDK